MNRKFLAYSLGGIIIVSSVVIIVILAPQLRQNPINEGFNWQIPENATISGDKAKITYMVPMSDGVRLATDVYVPLGINRSYPVLFVRTPYNKDAISLIGNYVYKGYIVVLQDMRGFYASEGELTFPFITEANDSQDALRWIARQPWCNGRIGTWGPSALGITQYLAAPNAPPELKCQMPIVATPDIYYTVFRGGEFRRELVLPWMEHGGFSQESINSIADHELRDNFWDPGDITSRFSEVHVPAIHLGGWYDIFTQQTIEGFKGYQYRGGEGAKGNSKLIMGPWVHEGYLGELSGNFYYPNQSPGIMLAVTDALLEAWLLDNFTRWNMLPTVAFYLMSSLQDPPFDIANNWYQANAWPIPFTAKSMYFFENGSLLEQPPSVETGAISYLYDPNDPTPTKGGGNLNIDAGPYDQKEIEQRDDVITFTSPILQEPFTFVGQANVTLYISSNCTDTDFAVKITDVYPDNTSMLITDTIIRARNRNSYAKWDFLNPGQIYELTIPLDSTAYLFKAGHRIRIDVSSANYPRFESNPNTGDPLWQNSTTYVANNTVFLNSIHASHIVFPEVDYNSLTPYSFDPLINAEPQNSQKHLTFTVQETPIETIFSHRTLVFAMPTNSKKIGNRF